MNTPEPSQATQAVAAQVPDVDPKTEPQSMPPTTPTPTTTKKEPAGEKKKLAIGLGAIVFGLLLMSVGTFVVIKLFRSSEPETQVEEPAKRVVEQINVIDVSQRPVVYVSPESDGRNVTITAESIKQPATEMEFELEYQAGTLLQGVFGSISLAAMPATDTVLMGSCSAGGACTYHEDVKGGTILTRFTGGEKYVLKNDWRYIEKPLKDTSISSRDGKFQMESPDLGKVTRAVVTNSPGYPEDLPGEIMSDIYVVQVAGSTPTEGSVTIRATETGEWQVAAWDGAEWTVLPSQVADKEVTAEYTDSEYYLFVVVKPE